ncbi:hypothetical protein BCR36DRAFT_588251 [Piromyces finnis]|uniref:Uncharacterized protein n=1 Tax=Piromyces finnis TaxID=1754191 RepID=A0A1Y1UPH8_9FUNG|nr:hypothetical protein BCR36DRAFT_588251 [Piromyces finnis]|eukprot:ORX39477.1 hypothetical protein BCR36DRAFT_588251 [Piromyces finnis]
MDCMDEDEKPNNTCNNEKLYYSLEDKNDNFQYYKYSNVVKYTCNVCRKETIFNGTSNNYKLEKPSLETIDEEMEMNLPNKFTNKKSAIDVNKPNPNHSRNNSNTSVSSLSSNNQSKNKKRKRNKSDLQQLLSKSNENKKPKTYSLNDFLSNL